MKRSLKWLTGSAAVIGMLTPAFSLSSCAKSTINLDQITEDAVKEFKEFTIIPHSSDPFLKEVPYEQGNVWNLSCYLKERISNILGKNVFQDKYGNIVFDVPATSPALETAPKIALQAHMDMVFSYDPDQIEFKPDPRIWKIALVDEVVNGKRIIHSDRYRTSIGADDGMGVAQILALIQHKEIPHGPIRCILTNCEENGSQGGSLLFNETYPDILKDFYYVVNLDGEDIGDLFVACSGAVGSYYYINSADETGGAYVPAEVKDDSFISISIDGFPGGHSGVDITKRRDNALVFMNAMLEQLNTGKTGDDRIRLNSISTPGTSVYNAIPKACSVVLSCTDWKDKKITEIKPIIQSIFDSVVEDRKTIAKGARDYRTGFDTQFDPEQYKNVKLEVTKVTPKYRVALTANDTARIIQLQGNDELWYGIIAWPSDEDMAKLTGEQTSSNIGPAEGKMTSNVKFEYKLSTYSRSSDSAQVANYYKMNEMAALDSGAKYKYDAYFEPWHVDNNKQLYNLTKKAWVDAGVEESKLHPVRTHGGLECSFWHEAMEQDETKKGKTAIISYGPQLRDVHSFKEIVEVDSVKTCIAATIYILSHANELTIN